MQTSTLCIPGLLCSAEVFTPQLPVLWARGPVTMASTLRGDTMQAMAASILETAPPKFACIGISMGGFLIFEILRQAPDRVTRLALLDTSARPNSDEETAQFRSLIEAARSAPFDAFAEQALMSVYHPTRHADQSLAAVSKRMGAAVGLEAFERQMNAIITRPDSRSLLASISVPTLVLVGDADVLQPVERSEEMARLIPGADLVILEQCGHGSTLEKPDAVNAALAKWIA